MCKPVNGLCDFAASALYWPVGVYSLAVNQVKYVC